MGAGVGGCASLDGALSSPPRPDCTGMGVGLGSWRTHPCPPGSPWLASDCRGGEELWELEARGGIRKLGSGQVAWIATGGSESSKPGWVGILG